VTGLVLDELGVEQQVADQFAVLLALAAQQPTEDHEVGGSQRAEAAIASREHGRGNITQRPASTRGDEHVGHPPVRRLARGLAVGDHRRRGMAAADQEVNLREPADVLDHRVNQRRLQQLQRAVGKIRARVLVDPGLTAPRGDRMRSDDHNAVDAEIQGGLQRRVQSGAAVVVPAARSSWLLRPKWLVQTRTAVRPKWVQSLPLTTSAR